MTIEDDAITNAISDSCEPTIIPDVYLQNINDKPVIGVSGTTRPADRDMSRELYYECSAQLGNFEKR